MTRLEDDLAAGMSAHEQYDADQQTTIDEQAARIAELEAEKPPTPEPPTDRGLAGVGIRVFPTKGGSVYDAPNYPAVLDSAEGLAVDVVTQLLTPTLGADVQDFIVDAHDRGMPSWMTVGQPRVVLDSGDWDKIAALLDGKLAGKIALGSGWNEPNHQRNPSDPPLDNWAPNAVAHNVGICDVFRPRGIPVGTPQLWSGDIQQQYDDLQRLVDAGLSRDCYDVIVWHLYMRGSVDPDLLDQQEREFRRILQDDDSPIVCTETGFFTADNYSGGSNPVTVEEQATLMVALIDEYERRGWGLGLFELLDDPDPQNDDREANFGTITVGSNDPETWAKKPAYDAIRDRLQSRD